jgi:hypothetical protein
MAGGVLYLVGSIILVSVSSGAPSVGVLQGLGPALRGEANPTESPRAPEVRYIGHHGAALVAGGLCTGLAIAAVTLVLLLLFDAARFRRPETWRYAGSLALIGGAFVAIVSVAHELILAITTHNFTSGHDFTNHAVDQALNKSTASEVVLSLGLVAWVAFAVGMVATLLAALRVGLMPRWLAFLGMFSVLIFGPLGSSALQILPAFWLVMTGVLLLGRWPSGDPPAWEAGEARPWPTAAEQRAARQRAAKPAAAGASAPGNGSSGAPAVPARAGTPRKRRRKGR